MLFVTKIIGKTDYKYTDIEKLLKIKLQTEILSQTLDEMVKLTDTYADSQPSLSINTIAKQKEFVKFLLEKFGNNLGS